MTIDRFRSSVDFKTSYRSSSLRTNRRTCEDIIWFGTGESQLTYPSSLSLLQGMYKPAEAYPLAGTVAIMCSHASYVTYKHIVEDKDHVSVGFYSLRPEPLLI